MDKLIYWLKFLLLYKNWLNLMIDRFKKQNSDKIVLRNNYIITAPIDSSLTVSMDETFILNRYTPKHMKIKTGDTVVDIGAHIGDFSIYASIYGASMIYAYEPDPISFKYLHKNIVYNNIKNIKIINSAVTNKNNNIKFYTYAKSGGNSIYSNMKGKSIKVQSVKLDEVIKQNKINKIDFLKIDCEGSEGLIFKSANRETWRKINKISLEYHNNVSSLNDKQLINILKTNNFKTKYYKTGGDFGYIYGYK